MPLSSPRSEALVRLLIVVCCLACLTIECRAQSSESADLDPALRDMLARDSACEAGGVGAEADPADAGQTPNVQSIHNSRGRNAGIIARAESACHCSRGNCSTYVYVKSGGNYRLALKESLASLRPLRGFKQSMPALSGKLLVSDSQAETIIYEWDGSEYHAGICAMVVQSKGHPVITKHPCAKMESSGDKQ